MRVFLGALALFALPSPGLAQDLENVLSDFVDNKSKKAWHTTVEKTERGFLIGDPDAEASLIVFTSFACKGCYDFAFKGDPELDLALLSPGLMNVEIRYRFNHPADMPLSLLATCGEPKKFKINHAMFMRDQKRWMERWQAASAYNRDLWSRGSARASLVSALDFDDMMAKRRGYSRMDINTCLSDRRAIARLQANAAKDTEEFGLPADAAGFAKPHFVYNGALLDGVNDWDALYEVFTAAYRPKPSEN